VLAERATPLAEAQESGIRVFRRPVFLLACPCLPLGFKRINIPPSRHGLGLFVGGRLEMDIKQTELLFPVLQFGIKSKPFRSLHNLKRDPFDCTALFDQLDSDHKAGFGRIIINLGVSHLLHIRRSSLAVFEVPCLWSYRAAILSATYPMAHLWWRRG
jgi:hypothetical protein